MNPSTAKKQKSDHTRLITDYEYAAKKAIMDEVTNSIDKNEVVKLPDNLSLQQFCQGKKLQKKIKKSRKISRYVSNVYFRRL